MHIVIEIPEDMWVKIQEGYVPLGISKYLKKGIVLPEQARIIDMDKLAIAPIDITDLPHDKCLMVYYPEDLDDATILEARKVEE